MEAEKLFQSSPSRAIDYYVSAERVDHAPALSQPEVSALLHTKTKSADLNRTCPQNLSLEPVPAGILANTVFLFHLTASPHDPQQL